MANVAYDKEVTALIVIEVCFSIIALHLNDWQANQLEDL